MSKLSSAYVTALSLPVVFATVLAACSLANAPADVNAGPAGAGGDETNVTNAASSGSGKASSTAGTGGKGAGGKGQGGTGQGGGGGSGGSGNGGGDSGAPCTMDIQCAPGYCDNGQCAPKKDLGATCGGIGECASSFCVGGLCCDAMCSGACEQCGDPAQPGKCTPDAAGEVGTPSCAPYLCSGVSGVCPANCAVQSDCAAGSTCSGGLCLACPLGGSQTFPASGGIATFVVPQCTKTLTVEAFGAQGGNANGGKGARMKGDFTNLSPGEKLGIAVGLQGTVNACNGPAGSASGGGGGGSYVWRLSNQAQPLIVAGGGGGGNTNFGGACTNGIDAVVGLNGTNGNGAGAIGGVNGNGGAGNAPSGTGSGGAGWLSKGQDSTFGTGCTGGIQPFGFQGGAGSAQFGPGGVGGFGGGGGAVCGCGGGGGYSGGGAGEGAACRAGGGGAGSFNAGVNQSNSPGAQLGSGKVVVTWM